MRALVTGAGGQVGRALVALLEARGAQVLGLDRQALDVADAEAVRAAVAEAAPEVVLHAAAWTDVDGAEADEAGALRVNALGTENVAAAARDAGARLVAYSTDFVFDGALGDGYVESDAVNPLSAYGRTKLAGEAAARARHPDGAYVVRTAWVYDEDGRNFLRTILRLAETRDEIAVVTDQRGSPTYAPDLAAATLRLLESCPPGTYHLAGGGSCTRHEWAQAIVEAAGLPTRVSGTTSDAFPLPARRPPVSTLRTEHACTPALPPWRDGVERCVAALTGR